MILKRIKISMCYRIGPIVRRKFRNKSERQKLKNHNFTILSQNCIGGGNIFRFRREILISDS